MDAEYAKAYNKGYAAGKYGRWPISKPILPPDGLLKEVLEASVALRNEADTFIATLEPGEKLVEDLNSCINNFDLILHKIDHWLTTHKQTNLPKLQLSCVKPWL